MTKSYNLRALVAQNVFGVREQGISLNTLLAEHTSAVSIKDKALIAELSYGTLRTLPQLEFMVQQLMKMPFKGKNHLIHYVILVGLYQLIHTRIPAHAAVAETVNATHVLQKSGLKNVVNGVLRQFLRQKTAFLTQFEQSNLAHLHPIWLYDRIVQAYPDNHAAIVAANNQKPPMWLRVNAKHHTGETYQRLLAEHGIAAECDPYFTQALRLSKPIGVEKLPGFNDGIVTVQDKSAQHAALLLAPQNGEHILDMCAAPGGKTTHILELAPTAQIMAVDSDPKRLTRIQDNLKRLKQHATVVAGDGQSPEHWAQGKQFDRILLDAPCSATGVIRRHPDIKWLRRADDITSLAHLQRTILGAIWSYLKPGGTLVYATCSILPEENQQQISDFLNKTLDASLSGDIIQYLPDPTGGDGFFYAVLKKASA